MCTVSGRMVNDFHSSALFHPKFPNNNIVHTALDVAPSVRFFESTSRYVDVIENVARQNVAGISKSILTWEIPR